MSQTTNSSKPTESERLASANAKDVFKEIEKLVMSDDFNSSTAKAQLRRLDALGESAKSIKGYLSLKKILEWKAGNGS